MALAGVGGGGFCSALYSSPGPEQRETGVMNVGLRLCSRPLGNSEAATGFPVCVFHSVTAVMAEGKHPVTFRTRKLSSSAPMVLHRGRCGRVGRRRTIFVRRPSLVGGGLLCVAGPFPVPKGYCVQVLWCPTPCSRGFCVHDLCVETLCPGHIQLSLARLYLGGWAPPKVSVASSAYGRLLTHEDLRFWPIRPLRSA
jgi:hypothetical protein